MQPKDGLQWRHIQEKDLAGYFIISIVAVIPLLHIFSMKRVYAASQLSWGGDLLPVNNGNDKHSCYKEILIAIAQQMDAMLSHHSRMLVLRVDLHIEHYTEDNLLLSRFLEKIIKGCKSKYKMKRAGYVWAREQEKAKKQHYHLALFLDGSKINFPSSLLDWIEERWQSKGKNTISIPENSYTMVKRKDRKAFYKAFYRVSYLAKTRGKGYRSNSANDYSASRIKHKEQSQ